MSAFTGPLRIEEVDIDREEFRLLDPLVYELGALGSGRVLLVPPGFVSDGASVPTPFRLVLPRWGRWRRPAILHDYACALLHEGRPHAEAPDRRAADALFLEAMAVAKVPLLVRLGLWAAVRLYWILIGRHRP